MDKFTIKRQLPNPQNELVFFDSSIFPISLNRVIYFRGLAVNRENNMSAEISCFTVWDQRPYKFVGLPTYNEKFANFGVSKSLGTLGIVQAWLVEIGELEHKK